MATSRQQTEQQGQAASSESGGSRATQDGGRAYVAGSRGGEDGGGGSALALPGVSNEQLARGLGWFSIGLGLAELLAPRGVAKVAGLRGDNTGLIRLFGLREIASGVAIFAQGRRPAAALWSRVAGDALDLTCLGIAFGSRDTNKGRAAFATANVLAVTALDVLCAQQSSTQGGGDAAKAGKRFRWSLIVNRPPDELYRYWHDFENLPRFMKHLESVRVTGEGRSHWVAKAPAGSSVEWDAEITEDRPGELIAWRSLPGADVENSGSVAFRGAPGGRGTIVTVEVEYTPPGGMLGAVFAKLFGEEPSQQAQEDLRRFKQVMETGEVVFSDGTYYDNGVLSQRPAQPVAREELGQGEGSA